MVVVLIGNSLDDLYHGVHNHGFILGQLIENLHHDRIQFGRPHLRRGTGSPLAGHHLGAAPLVESISPISQLSGYDGRNGWVQIHDPLALVQEVLPLVASVYCLTFVGTVPTFIFGIP